MVLVDPVAMLGPSDADLARAIAREHYKLQCHLLLEENYPSLELRRRRLRLIGLATYRNYQSVGCDWQTSPPPRHHPTHCAAALIARSSTMFNTYRWPEAQPWQSDHPIDVPSRTPRTVVLKATIQTQLRISIAAPNSDAAPIRSQLPVIVCDSTGEYHRFSTELVDAIAKRCLEQDPKSKVALEADTTDGTEIPHITIETIRSKSDSPS